MAEIRIRNAGPQVLKTLDRASIVNDRMIEHSLRKKESFTGGRGQEQARPDVWAENRMGVAARRNAYGAERTVFQGAKSAQRRILRRKRIQETEKKVQSARQSAKASAFAQRRGEAVREAAHASHGGGARAAVKYRELYQQQARKATIRKLQQQTRKASRKAGKSIRETVKQVGRALRLAIQSGKALIGLLAAGGTTALLVVIVCILFGAAFATFGDESADNYIEVSPEVEAYSPVIARFAAQYGIGEYVELIKAVMMQESGGRGTDPMQCSESPYNKRYSHAPGSIKSAEYSIDCGVHYLADCLKAAKCKSPLDMDRIRLALQGYNYGNGYIPWAIKRDGGYTVANAIAFSNMQAKKHGWDSYGDKQYPAHVLRYYPYGNYNIGVPNTAIVQVAAKEIGNHGGKKFWSWYGYSNRVSWCGCFVSWVGTKCGYVQSGTMPKFSYVPDGINWFKSHHQWQGRNFKPTPGCLIFIDWHGDGTRDHVGIVEKCDGKRVYTIEGNSSDQVARRSYPVGHYEILGYGIIKF